MLNGDPVIAESSGIIAATMTSRLSSGTRDTALVQIFLGTLITLVAGVLAFPVCARDAAPPLPVIVQDAWIRQTPGSDVAAAYLTVRNSGTQPVRVVGVECPIATHAMIHESTIENGQSRMRPHESVLVPAGQTVKLEPGGLHVMLHGLKQPVAVGQTVPIVLLLEGGSRVMANAQVRPLGAQ